MSLFWGKCSECEAKKVKIDLLAEMIQHLEDDLNSKHEWNLKLSVENAGLAEDVRNLQRTLQRHQDFLQQELRDGRYKPHSPDTVVFRAKNDRPKPVTLEDMHQMGFEPEKFDMEEGPKVPRNL